MYKAYQHKKHINFTLLQTNHSQTQWASSMAINASLVLARSDKNKLLQGWLTAVSGDMNTKTLVMQRN